MRSRSWLFWAGILCLLALVPSYSMSLVDDRLFNGVNTWLKPMKFQLSVGIYFLTIAFFLRYLTEEATRMISIRTIIWVLIVSGLFEVSYITLQGARNEASHFNDSTALTYILYLLMGVGALLLTIPSVFLSRILTQHAKLQASPYRTGIVWGLMMTGILGVVTGATISTMGSHWVGADPTDAGGLPLFGWVREGGDLRVAHFFALHALQILPMIGVITCTIGLRGIMGQTLVRLSALALIALVIFTLTQAIMGQAFLPQIRF